jgi:hypothetical protein
MGFGGTVEGQPSLSRPSIRRKSLLFLSEGDGTRTRNHRIDSPNLPRRKTKRRKSFRQGRSQGCTLVAQRPNCPPIWRG